MTNLHLKIYFLIDFPSFLLLHMISHILCLISCALEINSYQSVLELSGVVFVPALAVRIEAFLHLLSDLFLHLNILIDLRSRDFSRNRCDRSFGVSELPHVCICICFSRFVFRTRQFVLAKLTNALHHQLVN